MNYKITNGKVLSFEGEEVVLSEKDLYVKNDVISFVPFKEGEEFETIDAKRMLVMPGLINMHTHAYMTCMRNYADDVDFNEWLFNGVMPVEDRIPKEAAYWSSLLGFMEMIKTGTTSFVDMHMYHRQAPLAAKEAGIRGFIGRGLVGESLFEEGNVRYKEAIEEMNEFKGDTLEFILSPHAIYSASENLLKETIEEAKKYNMLKQIHLSESVFEVETSKKERGKTPVKYLYDMGFLDKKTILAHCVHLEGDDIELLKKSGATIVTNPASNAKLGNGFAPIRAIKDAGINLCIGTDGTASNNTLNMFREMGLLSLIHKGVNEDSTALPSKYVVKCATLNAARALDMEGRIGNIKEGAKADLIFVDLDEPSLFPNNNIISSLCYSANGSEVKSVMINGKFVMKDREILTIDKERVYAEVANVVKEYM